jgi:hypothetical protein
MGLVSLRVRGDVTRVPPDPGISAQAKADLNMAPYSAEIAQKIGDEVNKLVQNPTDPGTVGMIRQWLITEDPPTARPPYQTTYSEALNRTFMNVLSQGDPPVNAKINIGLVIKNLDAPKMNLAPTVEKLLADKCQAVVFVGEQAAWAIVQASIQNPNFTAATRDKLLAAIAGGVAANSDGPLAGFIADKAYCAINPKMWAPPSMPSGDNLSALIDQNLNLLELRIKIYQATDVPAFPKGDTFPSYWLLSDNPIQGWSAMSNAQQIRTVQDGLDLVSLMGQRAALAGQASNPELVGALREEGQWLSNMAQVLGDGQLQTVCDQVVKLSPGMPGATIKAACDAVYPQALLNQAFTNLRPQALSISSGPTSAPTSEPSP